MSAVPAVGTYYGYMLVTVDPELFDEATVSDRA